MAGLNPDRAGDFLAVQFEFDHVFNFDLQALRHLGADEDGIVPDQLGHRLGQFLEPAVVGELSVVDGGVTADVELDGELVEHSRAWMIKSFCGQLFRWSSGSIDPSVVQRLPPECFEVGAGVLLLPVGARQVVAGCVGLAVQQ